MLVFTLMLVTACRLFAQDGYAYEVEKVRDDIYVLHPKMNKYRWVTANIVVIINSEDVLVVDSGLLPGAAEAAIQEIQKLTKKPVKYLFNTHWHGDHWQGNSTFVKAFPQLKIIATEECAEGIKRDGMLWASKLYVRNFELMISSYEERVKSGTKLNGEKFSEDELKDLKEGIDWVKRDMLEIKNLETTFPTLTFENNMTLQLGGREVQFHYLGRGNTRGDGVIFLPQDKILITGDLVVHPSPYESGTFSLEWLETSQKLAEFSYDLLIPGHGDVQHDTSYLDFLNALFAEIIRQVNEAYLQGSYKLEEFQKLVNHQTVTDVLLREPRYAVHIKNLNSQFVSTCVERVHRKAHDGRLLH